MSLLYSPNRLWVSYSGWPWKCTKRLFFCCLTKQSTPASADFVRTEYPQLAIASSCTSFHRACGISEGRWNVAASRDDLSSSFAVEDADAFGRQRRGARCRPCAGPPHGRRGRNRSSSCVFSLAQSISWVRSRQYGSSSARARSARRRSRSVRRSLLRTRVVGEFGIFALDMPPRFRRALHRGQREAVKAGAARTCGRRAEQLHELPLGRLQAPDPACC